MRALTPRDSRVLLTHSSGLTEHRLIAENKALHDDDITETTHRSRVLSLSLAVSCSTSRNRITPRSLACDLPDTCCRYVQVPTSPAHKLNTNYGKLSTNSSNRSFDYRRSRGTAQKKSYELHNLQPWVRSETVIWKTFRDTMKIICCNYSVGVCFFCSMCKLRRKNVPKPTS